MRTAMIVAVLVVILVTGCKGPAPETTAPAPPAASREVAPPPAAPTPASPAPAAEPAAAEPQAQTWDTPEALAKAFREAAVGKDHKALAAICACGGTLEVQIDALPDDWSAAKLSVDSAHLLKDGLLAGADLQKALGAIRKAFVDHAEAVSELNSVVDEGASIMSWSAPASGIAVRLTCVEGTSGWHVKRIWLQVWE
jgi:hypothetical protein